jgi:UDP-N-acetylmuramoylalanine--D-glutamate ligase
MFSVDGKRVVVVGAARSGVAAAQLLATRGADVTLTDLRPSLTEELVLREAGVKLELGGHRPETLAAADLIVLSPGVSPTQRDVAAAAAAGVPVIGELELATRWFRGRIVAITGTKGKSTTTTLIGRMVEAGGMKTLVGGNIGVPLSAQVDASTPDAVHVIEASSFQLETTEQFHPSIAVLLNFSPDHLDRHANVEEYAAAKARIFANQTERDWAVINVDDAEAVRLSGQARARRVTFSASGAANADFAVVGDAIVRRRAAGAAGAASATGAAGTGAGAGGAVGAGETRLVPLAAVKLLGKHLLTDVVAAAAVADLLGISPDAMTRAVASFTGLEHALEPVADVAGIRFVNDSKATNVEAAERAIESFGRDLAVIIGGRYKGGDFGLLREPLRVRGATVIAIGEASPRLHQALGDFMPVRDASSMSEAVRIGFASVKPGGTVLLAPACSSFDMFQDYAERGRRFKEAVAALAEEMRRTREQ